MFNKTQYGPALVQLSKQEAIWFAAFTFALSDGSDEKQAGEKADRALDEFNQRFAITTTETTSTQ